MAKMTEQEYRARDAVNKSTLWEMRKSPAHYKWALEHPQEDTAALRMGRAIHTAVLEWEKFDKEYIVAPDVDRRTTAGKEAWKSFLEEAGDRTVLTSDEQEQVNGIRDSVRNCPEAMELLGGCMTETPIFWTDTQTGLECKCRIDAFRENVLIDLKSCADASTGAFLRDALKYGYDVQAAHYLNGYKAVTGKDADWYFIAVEKKAPYAVNVIHASEGFIDRGRWQFMDLMNRLADCRRLDEWPGYGKNELILPEWAAMADGE